MRQRAAAWIGSIDRKQTAARSVLAALVVAAAAVGFIDPIAAFAALVAVAAADLRSLLSLKNYFLAYVVLILGVGGHHFAPDDRTVSSDLLIYVALFVAAYSVATRWSRAGQQTRAATARPDLPVVWLVVASTIAWAALLAEQLAAYGVVGFYSGQGLADRIARYGHADFVAGLLSIVEQGLSILTVASAVVYVQTCISAGRRPNYVLLSLPLVLAPVLLLRRADFAIGLLFLLVIQRLACRLTGTRYSILASIPLVLGSVALNLAFSIMIGSLRESAVAGPPPNPAASASASSSSLESPIAVNVAPAKSAPSQAPLITEERTLGVLYGELSPVVGYRDVRENPGDFTYQFGKTIVLPLVAKIAPRNWFPDKPISSSAYYNQRRTPEAFAAGYTLPVTMFGDALLNFGYLGALTAVVLLGLLAGNLDGVLTGRSDRGLGTFMIVYYNFIALLRTDLANSLAVIFLTMLALAGLRLIRTRLERLPS